MGHFRFKIAILVTEKMETEYSCFEKKISDRILIEIDFLQKIDFDHFGIREYHDIENRWRIPKMTH